MISRPSRRGLWLAVALVPGLLVAGLAGRLALVAWGERLQQAARERLRAAVAASLEPGGAAEVELVTGSPLAFWRGRVERLRVVASRLRAGDVVTDRLVVEGEQLQLDPAALARDGQLAVRSAGRLEVRAELTEEDLNAYLRPRYEVARLLTVRLRPQGPRLVMEAVLGDQEVTIAVDGRLAVSGERSLTLALDRLAIQPGSQQELVFQLAGLHAPMEIQLGDFPVPVALERVEMGEGRLTLFARRRGG